MQLKRISFYLGPDEVRLIERVRHFSAHLLGVELPFQTAVASAVNAQMSRDSLPELLRMARSGLRLDRMSSSAQLVAIYVEPSAYQDFRAMISEELGISNASGVLRWLVAAHYARRLDELEEAERVMLHARGRTVGRISKRRYV